MSSNNSKNSNRHRREEQRRMKALAVKRNITMLVLLFILVVGLVSTTFAAFVPEQVGNTGTLIADIRTAAVNQGHKEQIADTKANVDISDTSETFTSDGTARLYFNIKAVSWWNAGTDGNGNFAYFFNNSTGYNAWSAHSVKYSGDVYYVVIPAGDWAGVILTRNNTSTAPSWDNKWNQTGDIDMSTTSNYLQKFSEGSTSVTWSTQKPASTASLAASSTSVEIGESVTLSTSLTSNADLNKISSTSYSINPSSGASISGNTFTATEAGEYTVTATVTYYPNGYSSITSTATAQKTITVVDPNYSYTVTFGYGGSVSPEKGSVEKGSGVEITATPSNGYTFAGWKGLTNATLSSTTSATTILTPTANGATVKANFRPDTPSSLTLTGSNVAANTTGTGTADNPFIVFEDGGFTLTAKANTVTGSSARYSTTASGTYSTTNTFTPSLATKGTDQTYTVYAKAYVTGYFSTDPISATAHYLVFSHLNGANTGFTMSSDRITDADTLTLSGAYVDGVAVAEKTYIKQTYQLSTDNNTFSDISGSEWKPDSTGTYYFRVKTVNEKTGETVYSTSQKLTVIQSTVYYDINVVNDGSVAGTVTLKTNGTTITNNKILSNSPLTISLSRPNSNYYIEYLKVDTVTESDNKNVNGNITDYLAYDHVKGNVEIRYKLALKPTVKVSVPTNADSISFEYYSDGVLKTPSAAGTYYVDYNSEITYAVTPKTNYYVSAMTGVTIGAINSSTVTGTEKNVTADIPSVTATLTSNRTVTVNIDKTNSDVTTGASMTIDGTALGFGQPKPLNYGAESTIVITPPEGCYAVVSGNSVSATIDTDGKATFKVILTGENKNYKVKFVNNPKIYMVQPQYGSVYVTDDLGNYYFNGDSVGYGTKLTVHVKKDHANATLNNVLVNDSQIGTADGSTFKIYETSTASADITVKSGHSFTSGTEYGNRRIFFTDNSGWGDNNVSVHYSTTSGDTNFTTNSKVMTYKFTNDASQRVYYADIPYSTKYVTFYNKSNTSQKTSQAAIVNTANSFWNDNGTCQTWQENYSDYIATDRETTIQQGVTVKNEAVTFEYSCDFGDDALTAKVISGNAAKFDFSKGIFSVIPTDNTHNYSLVEVKSEASTTVKYYLIKVDNFEIVGFVGLQKIYNSAVFNDIQLDLIVKGGILNYAAKYFTSDTNASGSFTEVTGTSSDFTYFSSLEGYVNSFLIQYQINSVSGVKYFRVDAQDGSGHKASTYAKTLFGTNSYIGDNAIYFYNNSNSNINKFNVRACFVTENNKTFVTMQRVGNTDYYRAAIPSSLYDETNGSVKGSVNFYLCNKDTFSNNYADFDGKDDSTDFYSFAAFEVNIPVKDADNIVYKATSINDNGISGSFVEFDY